VRPAGESKGFAIPQEYKLPVATDEEYQAANKNAGDENKGVVQDVPLSNIKGKQSELNQEAVKNYINNPAEITNKPLYGMASGDNVILLDGHSRAAAAKVLGIDSLKVEVIGNAKFIDGNPNEGIGSDNKSSNSFKLRDNPAKISSTSQVEANGDKTMKGELVKNGEFGGKEFLLTEQAAMALVDKGINHKNFKRNDSGVYKVSLSDRLYDKFESDISESALIEAKKIHDENGGTVGEQSRKDEVFKKMEEDIKKKQEEKKQEEAQKKADDYKKQTKEKEENNTSLNERHADRKAAMAGNYSRGVKAKHSDRGVTVTFPYDKDVVAFAKKLNAKGNKVGSQFEWTFENDNLHNAEKFLSDFKKV
jgi:ParB-like chromosome segregation protein Spo0J